MQINYITLHYIHRVWENIKENIKTSAKDSLGMHKLKQHKPWFDGECLRILDRRKQAKMRWLKDPSQSNVDHLNNERCEASRHFWNKKKEYLKAKIEELVTSSNIKDTKDLNGGFNDFKKGYQLRTNIIKMRIVIWLQIPTVFWLDGGTISLSY